MKSNRHLVISILLTVSLLAAPIAVAQPHAPSHGSFDIVELITDFFQDVVAFFAPASPYVDPGGFTGDDDETEAADQSDKKDEPPKTRATGYVDPAG